MRVVFVRFLIAITLLSLLGFSGCKGDTPASLEPEGDLQGINIFNVPSTMRPGGVHAVGAMGLYPGTATYPVTALGDWSSSDTDIMQLIGKGILRAIGGGTASITCTYKGISQSVSITVEGPPLPGTQDPTVLITLDSILVEPTYTTVKIYEDVQFEATAIYSNGLTQPITVLVDWRVSTTEYGFIIDADNANAWGTYYGLFMATGPIGTVVVSAEYMGMISNYVTCVVRDY